MLSTFDIIIINLSSTLDKITNSLVIQAVISPRLHIQALVISPKMHQIFFKIATNSILWKSSGKESLGKLHFGSWSQYQIHDFPKQLVATHTSALDLSWMGITRIGPPLAPPCTCPYLGNAHGLVCYPTHKTLGGIS